MGIVVGFSGGMDSATVLKMASIERKALAVSFKYDSKHNPHELKMASDFCAAEKIEHVVVDVTSVFDNVKSNLLRSGGDIPEGHYQADNMKLTVVPGRNTVFSSILLAIAESRGYEMVGLGVHSGDHVIYPDCRPRYVRYLSEVFKESSEGSVSLWAPFLNDTKKEILEEGFRIGVRYDLTRTCYKSGSVACGKCGSCQERLEAFRDIGRTDPIPYDQGA